MISKKNFCSENVMALKFILKIWDIKEFLLPQI